MAKTWLFLTGLLRALMSVLRVLPGALTYGFRSTRLEFVPFRTRDGRDLEVEVHVRAGLAFKPAIVILPGLDEQARSWKKVVTRLRFSGRRIFVISMRGQGLTRERELRSYGNPPRKIERGDQIALVRAVLEHYGVKRYYLVGHSYGGGTALGLIASLDPEREIKGVALIAHFVTRFERFNRSPVMRSTIQAAAWLEAINPYMHRASTAAYLPVFFRQARSKGALSRETTVWSDDRVDFLAAMTMGIIDVDTDRDLQALSEKPVPVHVMIAKNDELVPNAAHEHFFERVPEAARRRLIVHPTARHRLHLDAPSDVARFIREVAGLEKPPKTQ